MAALAQSTATASDTPPPTPVVLPGGRTTMSPFPTVLHTPEPSAGRPEIRAAAAILADMDTGQVLYAHFPDKRRPVASVTKIMTALLVIERTDPTDVVTVSANAAGDGRSPGISELGLLEGEQVRVGELLYALMLQSANDAAIALAEHVSGSVNAFVADMNDRARRLGLQNTEFFSPNGLDDRGYSSARDLVAMTRAAYDHPGFASVVATRFHEVPSPGGVPPRMVQNRNVLLWLYPGAVGVKTGFTSAAGFCVVATAERDGLGLVSVVLGEPGEPFSEAATLLDYGFAAFEQREVLREGDPLGTVQIDRHAVPVAAGGSLEGLVPTDAKVRRTIALDADAAFPPFPGEAVGTVTVSVPGMRIGDEPLVVTAVPAPPPPEEAGPWWRRALSSVLDAVDRVLGSLLD
jgi:D-alanyl-D-alanine carboxypeptidase (penicillin-binding protein 5/6)